MRYTVVALLALAASARDEPQSTFEVASIKPSDLGKPYPLGRGLFTFSGGRIVASQVRLDYLLQEAFDVYPFQISGAPDWTHADRFDIEAKPPASSQSSKSNPNSPKLPPNEEQRKMLQALLVARFLLKIQTRNQGRSKSICLLRRIAR